MSKKEVSQLPSTVTEGVYQVLPIERLYVDHSYQRLLVEPKVKRLVKNWNPVGVGYLVVSKKSNGKYAILDGQHRFTAMKLVGIEKCGCLVYSGLSHSDEAKSFHILNVDRALPTSLDRFKAALEYEDYDCLQIKKSIEECGYFIDFVGSGSTKGLIAVSGLSKVYSYGGESLLKDSLNTITECFPEDKKALQAIVIRGMGRFLKTYRDSLLFKKNMFVSKLQKNSLIKLIQRYRYYVDGYGAGQEVAFAMSLFEMYNKGLSKNQLPNMLTIGNADIVAGKED